MSGGRSQDMHETEKKLRSVIRRIIETKAAGGDRPVIADSWIRAMTRPSSVGHEASLAAAWDDMVAAATDGTPDDVLGVATRIAEKHGVSPLAVSFHIRGIAAAGPNADLPTGEELLAAAQAESASRAAAPKAPAAPATPLADLVYPPGRSYRGD